MMTRFRTLLKSKTGALIGVVIIAAVTALGTSIKGQFTTISTAIALPAP